MLFFDLCYFEFPRFYFYLFLFPSFWKQLARSFISVSLSTYLCFSLSPSSLSLSLSLSLTHPYTHTHTYTHGLPFQDKGLIWPNSFAWSAFYPKNFFLLLQIVCNNCSLIFFTTCSHILVFLKYSSQHINLSFSVTNMFSSFNRHVAVVTQTVEQRHSVQKGWVWNQEVPRLESWLI